MYIYLGELIFLEGYKIVRKRKMCVKYWTLFDLLLLARMREEKYPLRC